MFTGSSDCHQLFRTYKEHPEFTCACDIPVTRRVLVIVLPDKSEHQHQDDRADEAGDEYPPLQRGFQDNPAAPRFLGRIRLARPVRWSFPDHHFYLLSEVLHPHQRNVPSLAVFHAAAVAARRKPKAFRNPLRIVLGTKKSRWDG